MKTKRQTTIPFFGKKGGLWDNLKTRLAKCNVKAGGGGTEDKVDFSSSIEPRAHGTANENAMRKRKNLNEIVQVCDCLCKGMALN
jgi:hypothetical protein